MSSYSAKDRATAAGVMSSSQNSFTRQSDGTVDSETTWLTARERVARTLVSSPDVAFYLLFLCSNKARKAAVDMAATLSTLISSSEGTLYSQQEVSATAASSMSSATSALTTLVASGTTPSADLLARVSAETKSYAAGSLLPNVRTGTRLQVKGAEAAAGYATAKSSLSKSWSTLLRLLEQASKTKLFSSDVARTEALRTPAANLSSAAASTSDSSNASGQLLTLLAGASAVNVLGREFDALLRLRIDEDGEFPADISVAESAQSGGFISAFTLSKSGASIDPRLLSIAVGDLVSWSVYTATVSAVASTGVTLSSSTIPTGTLGTVEVLPYSVPAYRTMRDALAALRSGLPSASQLISKLQSLEGTSAGEVRDRCSYLASLAAQLDTLSTDTLSVLERLGADEPQVEETAAEVLLAYAPPFPEALKKSGRASLDSLKFGGFDRAETLLMEMDIDKVLKLSSDEASYIKRVLKLTTPFASTQTGK